MYVFCLIMVSAIAANSLGVLIMFNNLNNRISKVRNNAGIYMAYQNLKTTLKNPMAISKTVNSTISSNAESFSCIKTSGSTCTSNEHLFYLVNSAGTQLTDQQSGFDTNGRKCSTWGEDNCIFRYEFTWRPNCPAGCNSPVKKIVTGKLLIHSNAKIALKTNAFQISQVVD